MTNNEELDKLFFQQLKANQEKENKDVCPSCGHCKHCGRGGHYQTWPPYYWRPWYGQPYITWGTVTSSTSEAPRRNS